MRGVAIFAKACFVPKGHKGIPAQSSGKNLTRPPMPSAAPAVLLLSPHTQQGVWDIVAQ